MQSILPEYWFKLILNPAARQQAAYGSEQSKLFNSQHFDTARQVISSWPGYSQSPLRDLSGLAKTAGLASIHYKDESQRFGLSSFKPLGGAYAVTRLLIRKIQQATGNSEVKPEDILSGKYKDIVSSITVTAATDGNHGRSVAWGARMCGCRCVIYIHEVVTTDREKAISRLGAEVRRERGGTYDDAVRKAQHVAKEQGWFVIQDTTDGDDIETTLDVMHGYTLLASESIEQLPSDNPPTHLFLQAGVGGMAAAVLAHFWRIYGTERPRSILVEPSNAACCFLTVQAGKPTIAPGALDSIMAGLACGEISSLAWKILEPGAIAAMQINDEAAADCMRLLADSRFGDKAIVAGESAVAGLAALIAAAHDETAREQLHLDSNSRVLLIGSEGATDPKDYAKIVGRTAEEVLE
jgi:diaminopropionate ammonia-lyase